MARVVGLPSASLISRICKPSQVDDEGRVEAGAFALRAAKDDRPLERALSVYWLEYLVCSDEIDVKLAALRAYRANPPAELAEMTVRRTAWFATLRVERVESEVAPANVQFKCHHDPRTDRSICYCDDGAIVGRIGPIAINEALVDPHSLICAMPEDGPLDFAVRVHLAELVEHVAHV